VKAAGLCLLALLAGCGSDPSITAVRIVVNYPEPVFDQFDFRLEVDGQAPFEVRLPTPSRTPLPTPQDVVIYLPDAWAGRLATCQVLGLRGGDGLRRSFSTPFTIRLHEVASCYVYLNDTPDGAVLDGAAPVPDAGVPLDGAAPDAGAPADGPGPDAAIADAPLPVDAPPASDVAMAPDGGVPLDTSSPPADTLSPPPDATVPITGCAGNADRTAFLDLAKFPGIAGCGAPIGYSAAIGAAPNTCAAGWHWCKAEEVGSLPAMEPGTVSGSTCGWVDGTQGMCPDRRSSYNQASCAGGATRNLSIGGPTSGALPCTGIDLACGEPWKLAIAFDRWATSSVSRMSGGCLEHLTLQCTSSAGGASCWTTCCKN
jgi:hypothetical protein